MSDAVAVDDMGDGLANADITEGGEGMVEVDGKTIDAGKLDKRVSRPLESLHR